MCGGFKIFDALNRRRNTCYLYTLTDGLPLYSYRRITIIPSSTNCRPWAADGSLRQRGSAIITPRSRSSCIRRTPARFLILRPALLAPLKIMATSICIAGSIKALRHRRLPGGLPRWSALPTSRACRSMASFPLQGERMTLQQSRADRYSILLAFLRNTRLGRQAAWEA